MQMAKPWENNSGLPDPTAYKATRPITEEEQRASELVKVLKYIIRQAGFDLINRVELRDRRSGRTYR
ncbi:MAG: hypothetical protein J6C98_05750 [Oscillospiraceae bacterium]|nr:hypothetical protein [Oscillospiraceae bacterium]